MSLQPARTTVGVTPTGGQGLKCARAAVESVHRVLYTPPVAFLHPLAEVRSKNLRRLDTQHARNRVAAEHKHSISVKLPDPVPGGINHIPKTLFRDASGDALRRLVQRSANRRRKSFQVRLQDIVDGTSTKSLNRTLLADRSRHKDKWNVGRLAHRDRQCGNSIKSRKREVRENQVPAPLPQGRNKCRLRFDAPP